MDATHPSYVKHYKIMGIGLDAISTAMLVSGLLVLGFGIDYSGNKNHNFERIWIGIALSIGSDFVDRIDRDRREKYIEQVLIPSVYSKLNQRQNTCVPTPPKCA